MANPGLGYFGLTGDPVIDGMTHGYYWVLGQDRTVDWSVSGGFSGEYWINPTAVATEASRLLASYAYFANIKFNFVGYYSSPIAAAQAGAEIDYTLSAGLPFTSSATWAMGFFPTTNNTTYAGQPGDIFLNLNSPANSLPSYAPGSQGWFLFLHETGHVLGLKHPHDSGGTGRPTLAQVGLSSLNKDWGTVMSYSDDYGWNNVIWDPASPMILDVLALQYLYGPNTSTNTGDNIYDLTRTNFYQTYWDASGIDTISSATASEGWVIVLPSVQPSTLISTKVGLAAPVTDFSGTSPKTWNWLAGDFENATGSSFDDRLAGSNTTNVLNGGAGNDVLTGLGGNDVIIGGAGTDTASYSGRLASFTINSSASGYLVTDQSGVEGVDTVYTVEKLTFSDMSVNLMVAANAKQVQPTTLQGIVELYISFFNRVPDGEGVNFWISKAASGSSIPTIANSFYDAAIQYSSLTGYSAAMTNADFVNVIYKNVLGRTSADLAGLSYWTTALANGSETRGTLVNTILASAHSFKGDPVWGWVADLLDNKYRVGKLFSVDLGLSFNTPQESISQGMSIARAVTSEDVLAAIQLIGVSPSSIHLS